MKEENNAIISIESDALQKLTQQVVDSILEKYNTDSREWIGRKEAMELLQIKSTKLQELRDTGEVRYSKITRKTILYNRCSLLEYIERNVRERF